MFGLQHCHCRNQSVRLQRREADISWVLGVGASMHGNLTDLEPFRLTQEGNKAQLIGNKSKLIFN